MATLITENAVLRELIETGTTRDRAGEQISIHSNIPLMFAEVLYQAVLEQQPVLAIEVGMAFGVSSLAILTALSKLGGNRQLISIDPFQSTDWRGCGLAAVERSGFQELHQLFEEPDYLVLPRLLATKRRIDFAYIDGWHTFDYTLLDFWYVDKMMQAGGVIAFNDCQMPAVEKVINCMLSHRRYAEIKTELVANQDRYFKKLENWEPSWNFFAEF